MCPFCLSTAAIVAASALAAKFFHARKGIGAKSSHTPKEKEKHR
jgi:hypothetical protein